jgi:tetratricopeptide (TPR) repeat protein
MHTSLWAIAILIVSAVGLYWYSLTPSSSFLMSPRDTISSWDMQASHKDGGVLEKSVQDEIRRLNEHLADNKTEPPDYQLYVGLANQYSLLGDGKRAYDYLQKALSIDSDKTGLALHNMGVLMERLGAFYSARDAYQRAVDAQPHIDSYHAALINFLIAHMAEDELAVSAALERAAAQFDDDTFVFQLEAQWRAEREEYAEAISAWEKLREIAPEELVPGIDSEIARLRARL